MQVLFELHVEYKEISPHLVRRCFKIYIEQFDPERTLLLQDEIAHYLALSDAEVAKIIQRIQKGDFSDFLHLNRIFKKAITRSLDLTLRGKNELLLQNDPSQLVIVPYYNSFAKSKNGLYLRQKQQLCKFLLTHMQKSKIETKERKNKVFSLYERKIQHAYKPYFSTEEKDLTFFILKAFARSLDAHTAIFSEAEAMEMRMSLEKKFEGIGVVLTESIDGVIITDLIKNSPAQESGKIHVQDILMEINGKDVSKLSFDQVLEVMKDEKKTISLGLSSIDPNTYKKGNIRHVTLERRPISMDEDRLTYSYEKCNNGIIGKLTLPSFYENANGVSSENDIKKAIDELQKIGPLQGIIIDLRENAGGFLSQAIKVVGMFISNGVVVISKSANQEMRYLRTFRNKPYYQGPLILLTSKLSASASEIVAQALQDYGVAVIVGDRHTFGKGSIQYQTVTDENADLFFKVTVGKYYTVSGKTTQIRGVKADIVVPTAFSPYHIGERYLEYSLQPDKVSSAYQDNLQDLDRRAKLWFERNYLPHLQEKVTFWHKYLPFLRENSQKRLCQDPHMQLFQKKLQNIEAKINGLEYDDNILQKEFKDQDLQMTEAVNILKDMILLQKRNQQHASAYSIEKFSFSS